MVAGASSQKSIYRSFDEIRGVNEYAGLQGVEFTVASRGKALGFGLVQAREDQFEYGSPQDYRFSGTAFILYVSEDGSIRIEEKAGVAQRRLSEATAPSETVSDHQKKSQMDVDDFARQLQSGAPVFCDFKDEYTGYCEQCYNVPDCSQDKLTSNGRKACLATCSNFNADLPPLDIKKHACSKTKACTASNYKVDQYEQSEELYISAICPPRVTAAVASVYSTAQSAGAEYSTARVAGGGYRRRLQVDPCHFGFAYPGDSFAITVDSASLQVQYWHNGRVIYTSLMVPNFPMLIDAYMIDQGAKATNVMWKCPPKRCPSGTSASQCTKLRAKAPAGCNFINENFDSAAYKPAAAPYMQPPHGSRHPDGPGWWVWIVVAVTILCCCGCGFGLRNRSTAFATPMGGFARFNRDSLPSQQVIVPPVAPSPVFQPAPQPQLPILAAPKANNDKGYWGNMQEMNQL